MTVKEGQEAEVYSSAKLFVAPVLDTEESLKIRGNAAGIRHPPATARSAAGVFADHHRLAQSVGDPDFDVHVRPVQGPQIVENTDVRLPDSSNDVGEDVLGSQVVSRPSEDDPEWREEMNEVEAQRLFDALEEPVAYEADEPLPDPQALEQLQKRKLPAVRFPKLDDPHGAEAIQMQSFRRVFEEKTAGLGEVLVLSQTDEKIMILVSREMSGQEMSFKKADEEVAQESDGLGVLNHARYWE